MSTGKHSSRMPSVAVLRPHERAFDDAHMGGRMEVVELVDDDSSICAQELELPLWCSLARF